MIDECNKNMHNFFSAYIHTYMNQRQSGCASIHVLDLCVCPENLGRLEISIT